MVPDLQKAEDILRDTVEKKRLSDINNQEREWIESKNKHSRLVLETGSQIMGREEKLRALSEDEKVSAKIALLLHDIGRFYQFSDGKINYKIEHGKSGVEFLLTKYNFPQNPYLLLPIKYHEKVDFSELYEDALYKALDTQEQEKVLLIAKLVKDADKIGNFRSMVEKGFVVFRERKLSITPEILSALYNKKLASIKYEKTIFDSAVIFLCWQFELFFKTSRKIMEAEKINERFIERTKKYVEIIKKELVEKGEDLNEIEKQKTSLLKELSQIEVFLLKEKGFGI